MTQPCATVIDACNSVSTAGAVLLRTRWPYPERTTLNVCFLDGDKETHRLVAEIATIWNLYSGLKFDFPGVVYEVARYDKAHTTTLPLVSRSFSPIRPLGGAINDVCVIRVSFALDGFWSYMGTDALLVQPGTATMSLAGVHAGMGVSDAKRVILHEFGHALGLIHEHQHPQNGIRWNREAVYQDYIDGLGWTKSQVDRFIFRALSETTVHAGLYDPDSIMHYGIPPEYTLDGFAVEWPDELSNSDKLFIGEIYPKGAP